MTTLRRGFRAEWGRQFSVRSPLGCLLGSVVLGLLITTTLANDFLVDVGRGTLSPGATLPVTDPLAAAAPAAVAVLAAFAMLNTTAEFGTGSIRATLWAQPVRSTVLHAKALTAAAAAVPAGLLLGATGWTATRLLLGDHAAGTSGVAPWAVAGLRTGLLFGLAAVLAVGVAAAVRSAIGTLSACFVLLAGLAVLPERVAAWTPAGAAADLVTGAAPGQAVVVLAGWTAATYAAGWFRFERRDV